MIGRYFPREGPALWVELWENGRFSLVLTFESAYELDERQQDALVPALDRLSQFGFLDQYYHLFGPLLHYVRQSESSSENDHSRV